MNKITAVLAFGVFGTITTEFGVIGILPDISSSYDISMKRAGLLVSLFALVVAVTGPFVTVIASRFKNKRVVQFGLLVFIASNILSALSFSFGALLFARILPAFFLPAFFSNGVVLATSSVTKGKAIKAVAVIYSGLSVATVVGIPFTAFISGIVSWKMSFWLIAIINVLAFLGISLVVPGNLGIQTSVSNYKRQLGILKKRVLWLNIITVALISTGAFSVYSYLADYLKNIFEMNSNNISFMLLLFGITGIFGNWSAGLVLNKSIRKAIMAYIMSMGFIFLVMFQIGHNFHLQVAFIGIWGFFHMAGFLISQVWITSAAQEAPELANSLVVSTANFGIAFGAMLGGFVISNFGIENVVWGGIGAFAFSLITVWMSSKMR